MQTQTMRGFAPRSALKDGTQERAAATDASSALQADVDAEVELLRRAQELGNHALRLVTHRRGTA